MGLISETAIAALMNAPYNLTILAPHLQVH